MDKIEGSTTPIPEEGDILKEGQKETLKEVKDEAPAKGDETAAPAYDGDIEELKGKTADELAGMLQDRNKTIGRQGQELGKLKDDLAFSTRMSEFQAKNQPDGTEEVIKDPLEGLEDDSFVKVSAKKYRIFYQ